MKLAIAAMVASTALICGDRVAHAISACGGSTAWSPQAADSLPPRAHVVFWSDRPSALKPEDVTATIDGKAVPIKAKTLAATPYTFVIVDVASDRTGKLTIGWPSFQASYDVKPKVAYAAAVHATTSRYHSKIPHSTVREVFDGLAIKLDTAAVTAHVKIRRDDKAPWSELDVPVAGGEIHLGELGCVSNYTPALLEGGVDLDVTVTLPDGTTRAVAGLGHVVLPKLAKPTGNNPWDGD